jgi:hypothetical protein
VALSVPVKLKLAEPPLVGSAGVVARRLAGGERGAQRAVEGRAGLVG